MDTEYLPQAVSKRVLAARGTGNANLSGLGLSTVRL